MSDAQIWTKRADEAHKRAQVSGLAEDYLFAAQLYDLAGLDDKARKCYEAAERVRQAGQ